jgi:peptide/nickel transport system substrate-binding protein
MRVRLCSLICLLITVGLLVSACAPAATPPPQATPAPPQTGGELGRDPNTLIISTYEGISGIDPPGFPSGSGSLVQRGVYETLMRAKPGGGLEPVLAESYDVNEDNTVWTFHLRQGVTFHDGTPFNAEAVKENYVRTVTVDLGLSAVIGRFLTDPENQMVVVDDYTIQFNFDQPQPSFADALASSYGAWIVSPKAFTENEVEGDWSHAWLDTHAVGTGPYVLQDFRPTEEVTLVKYDDYWRGWEGNHFDKVVVKIIEDISLNRQLLEKGDVDLVVKVTPEDYEVLQQNPGLVAHLDYGLKYTIVFMGCYGPLADPKARQAMSYAFPYDAYVTDIQKGQAQRLYGPFTSTEFGYDPDIFKYQTDLDKARDLLAEAGVEPGTELVWLTSGHYAPGADLLLQAQFQQLGLKLKIEKVDSETQFTEIFSDLPIEGRFNFADMTWWPDYDDPWNAAQALYHSENWGTKGANGSYYANARADELLNAMRVATTKEEIEELAKEFQNVLTEQDPPCLWISEDPDKTIHRTDIKGYEFIPLYTETYPLYDMYRE